MKKYIVLYHAPQDAMKGMENMSKDEQAKGMEAWMQWANKLGSNLVDMGTPLMNGQHLSPDGKSTASKKQVSGYSVIQAESLENAKKLLEGHPHLGWNAECSIEVHEAMPLPGM